jgi:hypothetical protein
MCTAIDELSSMTKSDPIWPEQIAGGCSLTLAKWIKD